MSVWQGGSLRGRQNSVSEDDAPGVGPGGNTPHRQPIVVPGGYQGHNP